MRFGVYEMKKRQPKARTAGTAPWYIALGVGLAMTITPEPITTVAGLGLITYALTGKKP